MVPDIAKAGHSFKGAMAYYLHDKRQDGANAHPQTADRVAWAEMRNLACLTPETATRIMAATASRADELKAAAGIKATGRKSRAHVYAYSLAWHPDEAGQLDRAEMLRAADQTLKVLGAENHQAVIVCHRDQKHPHVHVILNRVDPATGKMLATSNDRLKLSDWANAYERERGVIVTPKREEKRQAREQAKQDFTRAAVADRAAPDPKAARRADPRPADPQTRAKSDAAMLKELHDAQKARHKQEWADLAARNKAQREKVYKESAETIRELIAGHKRETRPAWAAFFRAARESERSFQKREQSITGVLHNALAATPIGQRGSLSAVFRNVFSATSRETAFKAAQETSRGAFGRELKAGLDGHIAVLKEQRQNMLAAQRQRHMTDRAALIERQDTEKAKMREAWRQVYERRGKDPRYPARQEADRRKQEQKAMVKREFDTARELAPANPVPHPHKQQSLSVPAPSPAPAGMPTPAARKVHSVPEQSRTVDVPKVAPSTTQRDFGQSAEKPMSRADFWNQKAKEQAADRQPRDRSKDRDFDRER